MINSDELQEVFFEYILPILVAYGIAWLIQRLSNRIVGRFVQISDYAPEGLRMRQERQHTLRDLLSSTLSFLAFLTATLYVLGLFIETTTLVWMIGLFSAAFGIGANRLIADFLTGMGFILEDTFDIGEKVEVNTIEGVVEKIQLRSTFLRAPTGELYIIPNGEIRVIRNFSRGRFSTINIKLKIRADQLEKTIGFLEDVAPDVLQQFPNLLEPWTVISEDIIVGSHAELTLFVKTKFSKGAETRPRLLAFVQQRLKDFGIQLVEDSD